MRTIQPVENLQAAVSVPGSKSYTHRMLIAAALSSGTCRLRNALASEDTERTRAALEQFGVTLEAHTDGATVHGRKGRLAAPAAPLELGDSGTSMRFLAALACLCPGSTMLRGSRRMHARPIQDLIDALRQIGFRVRSLNDNGCPPVEVRGGRPEGGSVRLNCRLSSQFLSALLLIGPYTRRGVDISVEEGPVSRPYVDLTLDTMSRFGVPVEREAYLRFRVQGGQCYHSGDYAVEPDCSQAGYFWAAAAVAGGSVRVNDIPGGTCQGDVRLVDYLEAMGCRIERSTEGITVHGGPLRAVEADMGDLPDAVPTLAVVAAYARGTTRIRNVRHLRQKESDRLEALVTELRKMKIDARCDAGGLVVVGGRPEGARIDTYRDHRMAMSFAVAGLKTPGVAIRDEGCVQKSFPGFWRVFDRLYGEST
jgi:3-phosphoshikimate 1-carboxyvinyltransferase